MRAYNHESFAGIVCSPSLVELFRALCSVAEDNAFVSAAHPAYASLMERTLGKVVLVHVSGIEKLCQVGPIIIIIFIHFKTVEAQLQQAFSERQPCESMNDQIAVAMH